jgi:hypothetical protein
MTDQPHKNSPDVDALGVLRHIHPVFGCVYFIRTVRQGAVYELAYRRGISGGHFDPGPYDLGTSCKHAARLLKRWYRGYRDGAIQRARMLRQGRQLPPEVEKLWSVPLVSEEEFGRYCRNVGCDDPRTDISAEQWERLRDRYVERTSDDQ